MKTDPTDLQAAWHLVDYWERRGIPAIYGRGHRWVHKVFTPAVVAVERKDRLMAAYGWYKIGDVHDFNGAPLAAIRAYRRSLRHRQTGASWREIGGMQERIGHYRAAAHSLQKALRLDPDDECAKSDLSGLRSKGPPLYRRGDPLWRARELIERGRPRAAIRLLAARRSFPVRQIRARAFGALDDRAGFLSEWEAIAKAWHPVRLESADWFYMPPPLYDDPGWWRLLWRIRKRDHYGYWNLPESFFDRPELFRGRSHRKRVELALRYHLARTERDRPAMSALVRRNPWFIEARRELRRLLR